MNYTVREQEKLYKEIIETESKVVILDGNRGNGKTTLLRSYQNKKNKEDKLAVYTKFDSIGFGINLNKEFYEHYIELLLSIKLIKYFNEVTYNIYKKTLNSIYHEIYNKLRNTDLYLRNYGYTDKKIDYVKKGDYTKKIIELFKKLLKINSIELLIDRFEWTFGNNIYAQEVLIDYSTIFDKMVITLDKNVNKEDTKLSKVEVIDLNYSINAKKQMLFYSLENENKFISEEVRILFIDTIKNIDNNLLVTLNNMVNGSIDDLIQLFNSVMQKYGYNNCDLSIYEIKDALLDNAKRLKDYRESIENMCPTKKLYI